MTTQAFPNLAGVATSDLVEKLGTGKFSASYINWSRTMQLLREHAAGWLPELVTAPDGYIMHSAPVGAYLLIRFRNGDQVTPPVPQAIMDVRNAAIPVDKITARDITDTHRRGICMAAALTFGLAYELWAKMPLESGYAEHDEPAGNPRSSAGGRQEQKQDTSPKARAARLTEGVKNGDAVNAAAAAAYWPEAELNAVWALLEPEIIDQLTANWPGA